MVTNSNSSSHEMIKLPCELRKLVWGDNIEQSIFERWSQRFQFSNDEPSALIQYEGGPCSVLTTVQAHLLNELIFCKRCQYDWRQASSDEIDLHFLNALVSILHLLSSSNNKVYLANFHYEKQKDNLTVNQFHQEIKFNICQSNIDLKEIVFSRLQMWKNSYGVLLFLYSCLMTKTIDLLKKEIDDETSLPLIDIAHGHGSQCLTNLLITGFATPHCFDGDKDISGLTLYGIHQQASIGFLSSLEIYRLMEVGWFLKNPKSPIWILGSETHLTVIFSREQALVEQDGETPLKKALKRPLNGKPFIIYHYNGLPRSNKDKKVLYASAQANISDYGYGNDTPISAVAPVQPGSYLPITGVLRTKWPTIELQWDDDAKPSLN
ncbi:unnamed protein product [Rotaria magnacalcarata]|uniref:Ubiquitin carboxyl-terminal hydrolase MINDY n=1 Tax=Rotaria magnacalcarata TaxID=392030 RepID=A0A8S2KTL5_9BILA|nr:unnamed protein product [Rotaria magnacalcarata]